MTILNKKQDTIINKIDSQLNSTEDTSSSTHNTITKITIDHHIQ